jgi:hypothetical protein
VAQIMSDLLLATRLRLLDLYGARRPAASDPARGRTTDSHQHA